MATNDALFSVTGYVATQPKKGVTKSGTKTLTFRIGWTPREVSRQTGEWTDLPSSFASVTCYRKIAENAARCLRKGDPIVLKGTLRVREYDDQAGTRRNSVDVVADFLGHDLSKGTSNFSKQSHRGQQTAEEYDLSLLADGDRLPGDVAAAQRLDGEQPGVTEHEEDGSVAEAAALPDDLADLVRAALEDPDRDDIEGAGDDLGEPGEPTQPGELSDQGEPSDLGEPSNPGEPSEPREFGDSETTKPRGRSRKAEPVGAAS